jgi:hypothetical protein
MKNCSRPEMPSVSTELTDADRLARRVTRSRRCATGTAAEPMPPAAPVISARGLMH